MCARVNSGDVPSDQMETFVRMIRDEVIPRAKGLQGFKGGHWLADRGTGKVLGVTLFESVEALKASEAQAGRVRQEASRDAGLPEPTFHEYEVIATAEVADRIAA
jgi:hypothetical protein